MHALERRLSELGWPSAPQAFATYKFTSKVFVDAQPAQGEEGQQMVAVRPKMVPLSNGEPDRGPATHAASTRDPVTVAEARKASTPTQAEIGTAPPVSRTPPAVDADLAAQDEIVPLDYGPEYP